jgi:ribosome-binding factor A
VANTRPEKVGEQIRIELTQLLSRDVHDPGIGFITLTKVSVTPDLQLARVYYTTLGDDKAQKETGKALERASPFLRRQIAQRIRLRRVPELEFFYDKSVAQHDRIEQILQALKTEAASQGEAAAAAEPRERSGDLGVPGPRQSSGRPEHESKGASERVGGSGGAKPPGLKNDVPHDDTKD